LLVLVAVYFDYMCSLYMVYQLLDSGLLDGKFKLWKFYFKKH